MFLQSMCYSGGRLLTERHSFSVSIFCPKMGPQTLLTNLVQWNAKLVGPEVKSGGYGQRPSSNDILGEAAKSWSTRKGILLEYCDTRDDNKIVESKIRQSDTKSSYEWEKSVHILAQHTPAPGIWGRCWLRGRLLCLTTPLRIGLREFGWEVVNRQDQTTILSKWAQII